MVLSDLEIMDLCRGEKPMLSPFMSIQQGKPSFGLSSAGYDLRLGDRFLVPIERDLIEYTLDPIKSNGLYFDEYVIDPPGNKFVIYPGTFILAESVETFNMPDDIIGTCYGKSTYARLGILVNVTPLEPGWEGKLTIEIANLGKHAPVILHVGMGICQIQFHKIKRPLRSYTQKEAGGIYQNQDGATLPR